MVQNAVALAMAGLVAGTVVAWGTPTSRSAQAELTIPILMRLSAAGQANSGRELTVSVNVRPADAFSGQLELKRAVVLVVQSNVPWALVVRHPEPVLVGGVEVRAERREYRPIRPEGLVLTYGTSGVHEIVLDYRVSVGGTGWSGERRLTLVYALEGR